MIRYAAKVLVFYGVGGVIAWYVTLNHNPWRELAIRVMGKEWVEEKSPSK